MLATRALFTGSLPAPPPPAPIAPSGSRVAIPTSGYNAFPGMTLLTGDDLMLVYRYGTAHNSAGDDSSIDRRTSTDLGATWPEGGTFVAGPIADPDDLRDPCIMRLASGRLLVGYDYREPYDGSDIRAVTKYSDSGGSSWSSEVELPTDYVGPLVSVVTSQPVEAGGEVLMPGFAEDGGPEFSVIWRSDDEGATWGAAEVVASHASRDYQEPQLRVLASGRWLMLMRSESNHHTWRTYSDDEGAAWSEPDDVSAMTGRPDFVEYRPGRLVQMGRYLTSGDSPLHYAVSYDDGATWTTPLEVDEDETDVAEYSAPVAVSPGVVVAVYALQSSSSACGLYRRLLTDAT